MKPTKKPIYVFVNPNSHTLLEETLKKILLEKLLSEFAYLPAADPPFP